MFCPHCGRQIPDSSEFCNFCGSRTNNVVISTGTYPIGVAPKNKWIAFLLCLFLGVFGAHKFYEGKILLGIVYLFTFGLFGVGVVVDLIMLLFKPNPYFP